MVMATLGRVTEIDRCVDTLAAQTRKDFELIVVDQNPDDRLVPVVARARALGLDCHHLRQSEPNLCKARNAGIEHARGEVVAFPDDDCWYEHDVVDKVLQRFEKQPSLDGLVIRWVERGDTPTGRLHFHEYASLSGPVGSSITVFFRRERLRAAGNFDTALGLHSWYGAGEETDLMLRLLKDGAEVELDANILVHHPWGSANKQPLMKSFSNMRKRARGTGALYARHPLSVWVILRGLLSPWLRLVTQIISPLRVAENLGKGLGRIEGYIGWMSGYRPWLKR